MPEQKNTTPQPSRYRHWLDDALRDYEHLFLNSENLTSGAVATLVLAARIADLEDTLREFLPSAGQGR